MKDIYRKSALEKMASPEQLDKLIVIAKPCTWVALIIGIVIAVFVVIWACIGTIPEVVTANGVYMSAGDVMTMGGGEVSDGTTFYCFVEISDSGSIEEGMTVNIHPVTVDEDVYGYICGTVMAVSGDILTEADIAEKIDNKALAEYFFDNSTGTVVCVTCTAQTDPETKSGLKWSRPEGSSVDLKDGTPVTIDIRTDLRHPIELLFPNLAAL